MRLLNWVSIVAASLLALTVVVVLSAGTAGAQAVPPIWDENGNLVRFCGEGIDEGRRCEEDKECDLDEGDDEEGLCDVFQIVIDLPVFDNPDVYALANRFVDLKNLTTMYAWFDFEGFNFAAGYANRTEEVTPGNEIRAIFNWVLGVPTKLRQKEKRNIINQSSYLAVALTFSSVDRGEGGEADEFITLFTISDPEDEGFPIELEGCSAKVTVREPTKAKNAEDLSAIRLDSTWRLDCKNLPMPPGLACLDGSDDCPPSEQVSSEELLEFFEGSKDKIKARGKADVDFCESLIEGTSVPPTCPR
jgi:hypothetical protein